MADFDINALLSNPAFLAGVSGLLAPPEDRYKAMLGGLAQAQQMQSSQRANQLRDLQIKAMQAQQDFDPTAYMKTAPVSQGMAAPNAWAAQQANQMPAALGGPIGGQTQMPQAPAAGVNTQITPEPGVPTGRVDMQGLLQGGMQAGLTPQAISAIGNMLDPQTALEQQLALKRAEGYTLAPGQIRVENGQTVAANNNPPPGGVAQQIMALTAQRDALPPGPLRDSLDMAIKKTSGELDAMQSQRNYEGVQAQREIGNQMRQQQFANQQNQQVMQKTKQFSDQLQKIGVPGMQQQLDAIDSILAENANKPDKVPGYGRVEGAVPTMFLSNDAQKLRQTVQSLANVVLKSRSGAAVTEPEQKRFLEELGNGTWMPEERLLDGLKLMRGLVESEKRNAAAGVSNDVLDMYSATPGAMDMTGYKRPDTSSDSGSTGGGSVLDAARAEAKRRGMKM